MTTLHPELEARGDFRRARRHFAARLHRRAPLRHLGDVAALPMGPARLREIPVDAIVGTVDATRDFDAGFRPATDRIATRWQRVAHARRRGCSLPPIDVVERPDGYYVLDGRHRVSVARALGQEFIDAWARDARAGDAATAVRPGP
jgi:hypothetical protein